jgi:P27 family predicted phage terminase small subunit
MGQRGPKPKPPELQLLEGGRGHRPINLDQAFRPEVGEPDIPRWMSKWGRKAWKRLAPELLHYNLLSSVDREAFAMLCQSVGRLEMIETALNGRISLEISKGKTEAEAVVSAMADSTPKGMAIQSVLYQQLNREQAKVKALLDEFGLTPAQRARVSTSIRTQASLFPVEGDKPEAKPSPATTNGFAGFPDK